MASIINKDLPWDSIATTRDSFIDYILADKIRNQMRANFEKRKAPKAASSNFDKKMAVL